MTVQLRAADGRHQSDHQIHWRQGVAGHSEPFSDDPFDPVSGARPRHRLFSYDQAKPGVLHSIENDVRA